MFERILLSTDFSEQAEVAYPWAAKMASIEDGRVHCALPANYEPGSELDRVITARIDEVAARAALRARLSAAAP